MGCTESGMSKKTKEIEKHLKMINTKTETQVTMLLLGAGESGKTTISKQIKLIHLDGFHDSDRIFYKTIMASNILDCFQELINGTRTFELQIAPELQDDATKLLKMSQTDENLFNNLMELKDKLISLWKDKAIIEAYGRRNKLQLIDCCEFFLSNLDDILKTDFIPSDDHILRARYKTTGIIEIDFEIVHVTYKLIDVGGQRAERRKWINVFDIVSAVLFVTSLSEFDLVLVEDKQVNRMKESLKLFLDVCTLFKHVPVMLFLNKSDIFRELLLSGRSITPCFEDFNGSNDFDENCKYIGEQFVNSVQDVYQQKIYTHITCATDTKNIEFVFDTVQRIILENLFEDDLGIKLT